MAKRAPFLPTIARSRRFYELIVDYFLGLKQFLALFQHTLARS